MTEITVTDSKGNVHVWGGDPTAVSQIAAWKASYTSGYTPQVISPRDSSGNYTSDPTQTVTYTVLSEQQQAKEIAAQLANESYVPSSIVQTLANKLSVTLDVGKDEASRITSTSGEIGTVTKRSVISNVKGNSTAIIAGLLLIIFLSIQIIKGR